MMQRLRATTERVERSVARVVRMAGEIVSGTVLNATDVMNAIAWNVKPTVHQTPAFCTFGTYHTRRLREMPT